MTRVAAVTLCLLVHGCDTVDGGAVELSWKLRPASSSLPSKFVDCDSGQPGTGAVTKIRLHWEVVNEDLDPTGKQGSTAWDCNFNHGVTGFDLASGTANLWITPECEGGAEAASDSYIAPAIVQRSVIRGNTVSLNAVELVVAVSYCEASVPPAQRQHCICSDEAASRHTPP